MKGDGDGVTPFDGVMDVTDGVECGWCPPAVAAWVPVFAEDEVLADGCRKP